ncbi:MAG: tetratricopeptide repeat protein [Candidatus Obscuribacterales bacterium]|nr:tetratricopeptide repeat protein [Candidatus Obscuribacterales bacterium]
MQLTFNTQNVSISVALNALNLYREGKYNEAVGALIDVLDQEPRNWDARLMLGACYFRTQQMFAAERVFRMIADQAEDKNLRVRAREGLLAISAVSGKRLEVPAEFGSCAVREHLIAAWLS